MSRSEHLYVEVKSSNYNIEKFSSGELIEFADRDKIGPHTPEGESKGSLEKINKCNSKKRSNATVKRRNRRNKLKSLRTAIALTIDNTNTQVLAINNNLEVGSDKDIEINNISHKHIIMADNKCRDDVLAARQAKKLAKKAKTEKDKPTEAKTEKDKPTESKTEKDKPTEVKTEKEATKPIEAKDIKDVKQNTLQSNDEVDKAVNVDDKNKDEIKVQRAAKKAAKQAKKKGAAGAVEAVGNLVNEDNVQKPLQNKLEGAIKPVNEDMTVKDVVQTLKEIVTVAKDIKDVTEKVSAIDLSNKKPVPENKEKAEKIKANKIEETDKSKKDDSGKSKAELKAERRAKQEAQRAAKQALIEQKVTPKTKEEVKSTPDRDTPSKDGKVSKTKTLEKSKAKSLSSHRVNWFQHLYKDVDNESLKSIAINSHLHPAIIKLGVQLASRVVTGSNARCIALLDALKKMVRDYTLPAKTEFARGLESHLVASLVYLWANRPPSSSQENAVKFFRYHLTQLPNNVDEFDAKKTLQEEIDRYIREQIDMAGEAISIAVRNKISNGDNILTYGCSSLIERILREAWSAGVHFRTVVVGNRVHGAATQMLRRLVAHGLPCTYIDITALSCVMNTVSKVVLGAGALLGNGSVLGAVGSAQVALAARARNVPVLVACETHKFCERVQTDAFVYNEIGDPDDIIDKSDNNSPLKDWRSNQNLTPLNLTYDVTPASLVTAVVTELAILPCTSAPVVLRFKLSEYGV